MTDRLRIGEKLRRYAAEHPQRYPDAAAIVHLYGAYSQTDGDSPPTMQKLTAEVIQRVFDGGGTLAAVKAVASAMGKTIMVSGWDWRAKHAHTARMVDIASAAGLSEKAARVIVAILNSNTLTAASNATRIESIESVLFTAPRGELVLV